MSPQAAFYMQVINEEGNKSLIFSTQSLLLWPIPIPCFFFFFFQVLITGLLDCRLRKAERKRAINRGGGEDAYKVGHRNTPGPK